MIHIHPDDIDQALKIIHKCAHKYILIAEYHAPKFEAISYRGRKVLLWKGPYAERLVEMYDLGLRDYGFVSRLDPILKEDDLTWFLLEK